MRVTSKTRKLLADIKKMCAGRKTCERCPLWDKDLHCRLDGPCAWCIDDWEEYKNENA